MDMSGLGATQAEISAVMDAVFDEDEAQWAGQQETGQMPAISEADGEQDTWAAMRADREDSGLADWVSGMSDAEFAELLAAYEADQHLPGPQLAGAGGTGAIDLAGEWAAIDAVLAGQAGLEHQRQLQDAAEQGRRRGSSEVRLANAMRRIEAGTYLYGQQPADLANSWDEAGAGWADGQFGISAAGPAGVIAEMDYQLRGGLPPARLHPQPGPDVHGLATRIGLR